MRVLSRSEKRIAGEPAVWAEFRADTEQGVTDVLLHMTLLLNHFLTNWINPGSIYGSDTGSAFTKKSLTSMKKLSLFCCRFSRFSLWASQVVATTRM